MGFEPTISAGKRPQTYALHGAATETSDKIRMVIANLINVTLGVISEEENGTS